MDRSAHDFKCIVFVDSLLYEIPSSIFMTLKSNITHLYANHVGISELRRISFPFGQKLESVSIAGNNLKDINEPVFYGAPNLLVLDLSDNEITDFSSNAFANLNSLRILNLSGNQIASIPFELFQPLTTVETISLRENRLQIKYGIFPDSVRTLDLSYNNLDIHHKFKIFSVLNNLETLLLHGNRIENVHPSIFETKVKKLNILGLSDNPFYCSILADVVLLMEKYEVECLVENAVQNTSNIRGIKCIE
jgi:Leucine-rich repeat (LRR) protein